MRALLVLCFLAIACLVVLSRCFQPLFDQLDIASSSPNPFGRFLLKCVEHTDSFPKSDRVDRSIGIAGEVLHDLECPRAEPLPGLRRRMLSSELRNAQRISYFADHGIAKLQEVPLRRSD